MYKQTQSSSLSFEAAIKNAHNLLQLEQFDKCYQTLQNIHFEDVDQNVQIMSLKGYILSLKKNYQKALALFDQCIKKRPYHLTSKKRRALVLQKLGEYDQCMKQFQFCIYLQPQSKSIKNKIKRLSMSSSKSESFSSQGNAFEQKSLKNEKSSQNQPDKQKQKKQKGLNVKFGSFQVIEITGTEDSDERFAIIKEQINRLSEKKPKKSILKDSKSTSILKQNITAKQQQDNLSNSQKIQNVQEKYPQLQKQPSFNIQKLEKINTKKKSKSVTFKGDTNLQDFN